MASPTANYTEWLRAALSDRDRRDSGNDFFGGFDFQPPPPGETNGKSSRNDEVRSAHQQIWPPSSWWDERGVMPSTQKRYGEAQAFAGKALDFWGIPSAVLSKVSPKPRVR